MLPGTPPILDFSEKYEGCCPTRRTIRESAARHVVLRGDESGRPLGEMPGVTETEVSVVTLAELTVGVLMANDADRAGRVATLSAVESTWDPLPVDAEVARQFARIVADLRVRRRRVPILDALLAATSMVEQIPVVTQDRDYDAIPGIQVIRV